MGKKIEQAREWANIAKSKTVSAAQKAGNGMKNLYRRIFKRDSGGYSEITNTGGSSSYSGMGENLRGPYAGDSKRTARNEGAREFVSGMGDAIRGMGNAAKSFKSAADPGQKVAPEGYEKIDDGEVNGNAYQGKGISPGR